MARTEPTTVKVGVDYEATVKVGVDYEALAEGLAGLRECLSAMVAGLVADGFTEAQARAITTATFTYQQTED